MIRDATLKDIPELIGFLKPFHDNGGYKDISVNDKVAKTNLQMMLSSPMHKIWLVERDGEICAALGVVSTELWFTKRHFATNHFLCSNNKYHTLRYRLWVSFLLPDKHNQSHQVLQNSILGVLL